MLKKNLAVTLCSILSVAIAVMAAPSVTARYTPKKGTENPALMHQPILVQQATPTPTPDENARRKAKAEADKAEADALKAAADARKAAADALKAEADALKAGADARKAASDAAEAELKAASNAAKTEAEARKAQAEAEATELSTRQNAAKAALGLGDPATAAKATAPSGGITGDKDKFIEPQLLAGTATRLASYDLAGKMCTAPYLHKKGQTIKTLIINNGMDKTAVGNYRALLVQLTELTALSRNLIEVAKAAQCVIPDAPPGCGDAAAIPAPLILPAVTESVKSVADLVNLFRTDTEFKAQTVNIDERSVVTSFANRLLGLGLVDRKDADKIVCSIEHIFYPGLYPLMSGTDGSSSSIVKAFRDLKTAESALGQQVERNNEMIAALNKKVKEQEEKVTKLQKIVEDKQKEIEALLKKPQTPAVRKEIAQAQGEKEKAEGELKTEKEVLATRQQSTKNKVARLKRSADDMEAFKKGLADISGLVTAVDATKQTALVGLLRAERLSEEIAKPGTFLLDIRVNAAGTTRIRKNIWWNAKDEHTGGVTVEANLFNNTDHLVFGTIVDGYIDYAGSGKIRRQRGFKKLNDATKEIEKQVAQDDKK